MRQAIDLQAIIEAASASFGHDPRWNQRHLDDLSKLVIEFNDPNHPLQISVWSLGSVEVASMDQGTEYPVIEHAEFGDTTQAANFVCQTISRHERAAT